MLEAIGGGSDYDMLGTTVLANTPAIARVGDWITCPPGSPLDAVVSAFYSGSPPPPWPIIGIITQNDGTGVKYSPLLEGLPMPPPVVP